MLSVVCVSVHAAVVAVVLVIVLLIITRFQ